MISFVSRLTGRKEARYRSESEWWKNLSAAESLQFLLSVPRFFSELPLVFKPYQGQNQSPEEFYMLPKIVMNGLPPRGRAKNLQYVPGPPYSGYYLELEVSDRGETEELLCITLKLKVRDITLETYELSGPHASYRAEWLPAWVDQHLVKPFSRRSVTEERRAEVSIANFRDHVKEAILSGGQTGVHSLGLSYASMAYRSQENLRKILWPKVYDSLLYSGDVDSARIVAELDEMKIGREKRHLACYLAEHYGHRLPAILLCCGVLESLEDPHLLHVERLLFPEGTPAPHEKTNTLQAHFGSCLAELQTAGYYLGHPEAFKLADPATILASLHWTLPLWPIWYGESVWAPLRHFAGDARTLHKELRRLLPGLLTWCRNEGPKPWPPAPPLRAKLAPIASDTNLRLFDEHNEDPTYRQLRGHLMAGDWSDVQRHMDITKDCEEREFYLRALTRSKELPTWMEEWSKLRPNDPSVWLLRGYHSTRLAWAAGYDAHNPDHAASKNREFFYSRLEVARDELLQAAALDPFDPCPYAGLLMTAIGLRLSHQKAYQYFVEMTKRDQEHYWGHWHMLQYLCQKWHGSHELMFRFARDLSEARPAGSDIHVLLVSAHIERAAADGMTRSYFCKDCVREELRLAYRRSLKSCFNHETRNTFRVRNAFALAFFLAEMKTELREVLGPLRGRITEIPWRYFGDPLSIAHQAHAV